MKLVLSNGEKITIHRQNCGYEFPLPSTLGNGRVRHWNINPIEIIEGNDIGCFTIGEWGTVAGDKADKMIPTKSVVYIEDPDKWERSEVNND